MDLKSFYVQPTQGLDRENWKTRMDKSSIVAIWTNSWVSTTSMDLDVASVEGETQLQTYM
jgi:hypothetical protein